MNSEGHIDYANDWWTSITGPRKFIIALCACLKKSGKAVVTVPADIPFRQQMRSSVIDRFKRTSSQSPSFELIDVADGFGEVNDPGISILKKYGRRDVAGRFRNGGGSTVSEYISSNGVLSNRLLYVKGVPSERVDAWQSFMEAYNPGSYENGMIVLEIQNSSSRFQNGQVIDYEDYVRPNDLELCILNSDKLQSMLDQNNKQRYFANILRCLCRTDIELAYDLLDKMTDSSVKGDIFTMLESLANDSKYMRRGNFEGSTHILHAVRQGDTEKIKRCIWNAQVSSLFPLIELYRRKLIGTYEDRISYYLQQHTFRDFDGKTITHPYDLDVGQLDYVLSKVKGVQSSDLRDSSTCRELRNAMAHIDIIDACKVNMFLFNSENLMSNSYD